METKLNASENYNKSNNLKTFLQNVNWYNQKWGMSDRLI